MMINERLVAIAKHQTTPNILLVLTNI